MTQLPEELMASQLQALLQDDAQFRAALNAYAAVQLPRQYAAALQELNKIMQNPERDKNEVSRLMSKVETSGTPSLEHLSALIELERITREAGGPAYSLVEEMVFKALRGLIRHENVVQNESSLEQLLAFLDDAFGYMRKYDAFATQRRYISLEMAATIANRSKNDQHLALLHKALAHPTSKIRGQAIMTIFQVYRLLGSDIPASLIDRFQQMAEKDRSKKVRNTAHFVLQRRLEVCKTPTWVNFV